jgi:hypothetical protein
MVLCRPASPSLAIWKYPANAAGYRRAPDWPITTRRKAGYLGVDLIVWKNPRKFRQPTVNKIRDF